MYRENMLRTGIRTPYSNSKVSYSCDSRGVGYLGTCGYW